MSQSEFLSQLGHVVVGGYYDHQKIRTAQMNRIRDVIRKKNEDIPFDRTEEKKDVSKKFAAKYRDDKISKLLDEMKEQGKLTGSEYDYVRKLLDSVKLSEGTEKGYKPLMEAYILTEPIWSWLRQVKGIGPVLGANLIHRFGHCEKYEHVSSVWKHAGLHVVDGKAPKRTKGEKMEYDPRLRTNCWKIADSFIKQRTPVYRPIYDGEKTRQMELLASTPQANRNPDVDVKHPDSVAATASTAPKNKKHADLRARRKMVKIFLSHYWSIARRMKGLSITRPYAFDKLGHSGFIPPPFIDEEWLFKGS